MAATVLYLSYDGALDPLGRSQIVPYLEGLGRRGHQIDLVTFEKPAAWRDRAAVDAMRMRLVRAGIRWHPLRYHKRPSVAATAYDILAGTFVGARLARRCGARIVHARSYVAGVMALVITRCCGGAFIFDMRGFWADERVDGGLWKPGGALYRAAKWVEQRLFASADGIVSLTDAGLRLIGEMPVMRGRRVVSTVIPTCVDVERFRPAVNGHASREPFVVGYLGSLGTWYLLSDMVAMFKLIAAHRPASLLSVLSNDDRPWIEQRLRAEGLAPSQFRIERVAHEDVPERLAHVDVSLCFYRAGWSRAGTCPTKLGESLACGVPVLANRGIGDVETIVTSRRVGAIVRELTPAGFAAAWDELERLLTDRPALTRRCRETAEELFSLARGVERYSGLYTRVSEGVA